MPAAQSSATSAAVASGSRPTLGLMMVPISGRPSTPGEPARAGDAEARTGIGGREGRRHADVEQPQPAHGPELEQVAGNRGDEVGQGRAEIRQRPGQGHGGARDALAVHAAGRRQRAPRHGLVEDVEGDDARGRAFLELRRLAGDRDEGAARLLAGHDLGGAARIDRRLEKVVGFDAVGEHVAIGSQAARQVRPPSTGRLIPVM